MCGVEEREVAFLLTDSQIIDEIFLEDISNILNSGEVPGTIPCCPKLSAEVASFCRALALQHAVTPAVRLMLCYSMPIFKLSEEDAQLDMFSRTQTYL